MLKTTNTLQNKKIFIQIGAGAGDQDIRSGCRDGFTEYIKSLNSFEIDRILLVEPNPLNLENLRNCWSNYPQAEIYEIGIVPPHHGDKITFYYAEEDAPNYQVFSMNRQHVEKHYPFGSILSIDVPTETLESFLSKNVGNHLIELIAMDVEGIDAEIMMSSNWELINCNRISFEYIHLKDKLSEINCKLWAAGFVYKGAGLDVNGFDLMYKKSARTLINYFRTKAMLLKIFSFRLKDFFYQIALNVYRFLRIKKIRNILKGKKVC